MCVQYSTTRFNTNIPISFQALVGEVALILPSTFQDLRLSASLLAPGDQQEEAPPQTTIAGEPEDQEPARDPEVPPLPPGSLETVVVSTLYGYTVQCDLTYCLPILLRRSPPQNCVLHCRHPSPRTNWTDWLPGMMGRAPIKAERQQEEEGDEEEEDVTIVSITPSQPIPAARKRSRGAEGPPGEGGHRLPLGGPPVTSPAGPDPLLMGALGHSLDVVSGRIRPVSSALRWGDAPVLPPAPQAPAPLVPGGFRKPATPAEQAAIQAAVTRVWVEHQGHGRGASPTRGTPRPAHGRSTGSPHRGRITPRPQPLIPAPPLFGRPAPQGAVALDLALPAPSGTGSATPEALEERLLSEVPLERQSGLVAYPVHPPCGGLGPH